jgi:hypothetical protein
MFWSDGKKYIWRKPGEDFQPACVQPTVKHRGGNVLVLRCMTYGGVGSNYFNEGIMNDVMYKDILKQGSQTQTKSRAA